MYRVFLVFVAMMFFANPTLAREELIFGIYATDKAKAAVIQFRPILNQLESDLSRKLNRRITITTKVYSNYEFAIKALANGNSDFSRFGAASYILTKNVSPGITILAAEHSKFKDYFTGVICVESSSPITEVAQLNNESFAFVSRSSTSRYIAQQHLNQAGLSSKTLNGLGYLGRHDKVGIAVASGTYTAGALKESTFKQLKSVGLPLRKIFTFELPNKPWIASAKLDSTIKKALKASLLAIEDKRILKELGKDGFMEVNASYYEPLESSIAERHLF